MVQCRHSNALIHVDEVREVKHLDARVRVRKDKPSLEEEVTVVDSAAVAVIVIVVVTTIVWWCCDRSHERESRCGVIVQGLGFSRNGESPSLQSQWLCIKLFWLSL